MIGIDATEVKKVLTPPGTKTKKLTWLEELTGADVIVTVVDLPLTKRLLPDHLEQGAVLVQIKRGADLLSSIGTRMKMSIAKMVKLTSHQWQRVLLPIGIYMPDRSSGKCLVATPMGNEKSPHFYHATPPKDWSAYQTALWRWRKRGGVVEPGVYTDGDLKRWFEREQVDLRSMLSEDKNQVWPDAPKLFSPAEKDDPLQELIPIKDWRIVAAAIPGIGPKRINDFIVTWQDRQNTEMFPTGVEYFEWLLRSPLLPRGYKVRGYGVKTFENCRKLFGLTNDWAHFGQSYLELELGDEG